MEVPATHDLVGSSGLGTSPGMVQEAVAWEECIKLCLLFQGFAEGIVLSYLSGKTMPMSFVDNGATKGTMGPLRGTKARG